MQYKANLKDEDQHNYVYFMFYEFIIFFDKTSFLCEGLHECIMPKLLCNKTMIKCVLASTYPLPNRKCNDQFKKEVYMSMTFRNFYVIMTLNK